MNIKHIITLAALLTYTSTQPFEIRIETTQDAEEPSVRHYVSHLAIGMIAEKSTLLCLGMADEIIDPHTDIEHFLSHYMRLSLQEKRHQLIALTRLIASTSMLITGGLIFYKSPQWTDTYLLKKENKRSFRQNFYVLLNRIFFKYPFGILTGEYFTH
ncbi:MAG: hypothetical protein M1114_04145 [Candidatus Dependentiae bacterium]|nr:hypothetical protein [Candidatus Dependentiae bacterium]